MAGIVYAKDMENNENLLTEYDLAEPIERCCATYPEECEVVVEEVYYVGRYEVCLTHNEG